MASEIVESSFGGHGVLKTNKLDDNGLSLYTFAVEIKVICTTADCERKHETHSRGLKQYLLQVTLGDSMLSNAGKYYVSKILFQ